jgi:hypothetical protein
MVVVDLVFLQGGGKDFPGRVIYTNLESLQIVSTVLPAWSR